MPGPNTTGLPQPSDYRLGRGRLFISVLNAAGRPTSWRDMGNAPEVTSNLTSEKLEHFSSRAGKKTLDNSVSISDKITLSFKLEEFNHQNMAAVFSGTMASNTNPAVAGFTEWLMVPDGELALGVWYNIKNSSHVRAYDIDNTKLTVKTNEGSPVTLVENTDFTVERDTGRIFILSTSTAVATAIAAVKGLKVTLTADAGATASIKSVKTLNQSAQNVALLFIAENPANADHREEWEFHKGTLAADGDISLIGDDWGNMSFTFAAEQNTLLTGSPTLTITDVPT